MPWSPRPERLSDPRLDRYRNRVAELRRGSQLVGHVIVLPEYVAEAVGGHLWWTRWAPFQEISSLTVVLLDGARIDEIWIHPPELEAEFEHWARDEMPLLGEVLGTRWLGASESLQVARREFGVEGFDDSGQVIWKPSPDNKLN